MKCILIDDDSFQRHLLSQYVDQIEQLELIGEFDSAINAIQFLSSHHVDLIFLDIEMPNMNGVEFLEQFKPQAQIIFISSKEEYAIDGFHLGVTDYLLKPISFARFSRSVNKLLHDGSGEATHLEKNKYLFIKDKGIYQKIQISDIQYIQSSSEYVTIHTKVKRTMLYSSMDNILNKLPVSFIRIHRSFIVNLDVIECVNGNTVEINGQSISISKTYREDLLDKLGLHVSK